MFANGTEGYAYLETVVKSLCQREQQRILEEHQNQLSGRTNPVLEPATHEFRKASRTLLELKKADGDGWIDDEEVIEVLHKVITTTDHGSATWNPTLPQEFRKILARETEVTLMSWLRNELEDLDAEDAWTTFEIMEHLDIFLSYLSNDRNNRPQLPNPITEHELQEERLSMLASLHINGVS
jgi:hypothetical protein